MLREADFELTVSAHSLAQLHSNGISLQFSLVARLDFHCVCSDDLLNLAALEAHLRLSHDLCVGT